MKNLEKMQFLVRWPPYYKTCLWRTLNGPPLRRFLRKAIFAVTFAQKVPKKFAIQFEQFYALKKRFEKADTHRQMDLQTNRQTTPY